MIKTVLWIGGWASHFDAMRPHLLPLAPDAIWIALDPHEAALNPSQLDTAIASLEGMGGPCVIMAWSLGAMHVLRHLQVTGRESPVPTLLLNPIQRLVGEGAPWPERALTRMRRRLTDAPESVMGEFWELMVSHGAESMPADFASAWLKAAQGLSIPALDAGLAYLAHSLRGRADHDPAGDKLWMVGDADDPIAPFDSSAWQAAYPRAKLYAGQGGHLPFFGDQILLREVLSEIWRSQA